MWRDNQMNYLKNMFKKGINYLIVLTIGRIVLNIVIDEIKPNRLNSKWGIPYIGCTYDRRRN